MAKQHKNIATDQLVEPVLRLEWREAAELDDNPQNWRRHPDAQLQALEGVLQEVGWAGVLLWNETTSRLVDGHARKAVALKHGGKVPVLIGSWTEEQEQLILATLDPIAVMAQADAQIQAKILADVETGSAILEELLAGLAASAEFELGILSAANADEKAAMVRPQMTTSAQKAKQVKSVIYTKDVAIFERALMATGKRNRSEALIEVCASYLEQMDAKGQLDI